MVFIQGMFYDEEETLPKGGKKNLHEKKTGRKVIK